MSDLREAVEGLIGPSLDGEYVATDGPLVYRSDVLALIPENAVLVTQDELAEALLDTQWWRHCHVEQGNEWTSGELAAAILARLRSRSSPTEVGS